MKLENVKKNDFTVITIDGRVDSTNYVDLDEYINSLVAQGENSMILNCEKLEFISSAGLRVFLMALKNFTKSGGVLRLCCLSDQIAQIFDISGFTALFSIFGTEDEALNG